MPGVIGVGYGLKETAGRVTRIRAWRVYVCEKRPVWQLSASVRIPARIGGLPTDVITHAPVAGATGSALARPGPGAKIANARGVPGTLGCIAYTLHDRRPVLLSNWHVLFGRGGAEDGTVWLVDETSGTRRFSAIGRTLYGKIGTVQLCSETYYVDCAVGSFMLVSGNGADELIALATAQVPCIAGHEVAQPGLSVAKIGTATGTTAGIVVDTNYSDYAWIEGRPYSALQQLLVKPADGHPVFSAEGDSGALIINTAGSAVGLLWGTNSRGEGVACHIGPVLHTLNIGLDPSRNGLGVHGPALPDSL